MADKNQFPVFIVCRDRVTDLRKLVDWLEGAGQSEIYLVDNNSSYPPLLEYYKSTKHSVIRLPDNFGPRVLWQAPIVSEIAANRYYVVSDPDVIPDPECPMNAIEYFYHLLQKYPQIDKVGFGLRIDDIPNLYRHRDLVIKWEAQFWSQEVEPGVYQAALDTTLMLCRPLDKCTRALALRTGFPFVARHTAWYLDLDNLSEEEGYYQANARVDVSNWNLKERPVWMEEWIKQIRNLVEKK